ncbi:DNA repair endonuclease UVH1 [Diplonema papillatum]|nr:DNA repair endonuclease UVH1 [Diplonema papillatum]
MEADAENDVEAEDPVEIIEAAGPADDDVLGVSDAFIDDMASQMSTDSGLLVAAAGLANYPVVSKLCFSAIQQGDGLVLLLNASPECEAYIDNWLYRHRVACWAMPSKLHLDVKPKDREDAYKRSFVCSVTSRHLIVDLLSGKLDAQRVKSAIVWDAHKVDSEDAPEAFVLRSLRDKNRDVAIRCITDSPDSFFRRGVRLHVLLRRLLVAKVWLWPRFHMRVESCLQKAPLEVVEMQSPMPKSVGMIQKTLVSIIDEVLREVKVRLERYLPAGTAGAELTTVGAITGQMKRFLKEELGNKADKLSDELKRLLEELETLRHLLRKLHTCTSVEFFELVEFTTLVAEGRTGRNQTMPTLPAFWLLAKAARDLIPQAKSRLFRQGKIDVEKDSKFATLDAVMTDIQKDWAARGPGYSSTDPAATFSTRPRASVLLLVRDNHTKFIVGQLLQKGEKALMNGLIKRYVAHNYAEQRMTASQLTDFHPRAAQPEAAKPPPPVQSPPAAPGAPAAQEHNRLCLNFEGDEANGRAPEADVVAAISARAECRVAEKSPQRKGSGVVERSLLAEIVAATPEIPIPAGACDVEEEDLSLAELSQATVQFRDGSATGDDDSLASLSEALDLELMSDAGSVPESDGDSELPDAETPKPSVQSSSSREQRSLQAQLDLLRVIHAEPNSPPPKQPPPPPPPPPPFNQHRSVQYPPRKAPAPAAQGGGAKRRKLAQPPALAERELLASEFERYFGVFGAGSGPAVEVHTLSACANALDALKPSWVVLYDTNVAAIRRLEVYAATYRDWNTRVYVLGHDDSTEQQVSYTELSNEVKAFQWLASARSQLPDASSTGGAAIVGAAEAAFAVRKARRAGGLLQSLHSGSKVLVDLREFRCRLPSAIHRARMVPVPAHLELADYVLSPEVAIERKSVPDLMGSLASGRLLQQIDRLCRKYRTAILLIEFDGERPFSLTEGEGWRVRNLFPMTRESWTQRMTPEERTAMCLDKVCSLVALFSNLRVWWSRDQTMSAQLIEAAKRGLPEPEEHLAAEEVDNSHAATELLRQMPGVTEANIGTLVANFSSLSDVANCTCDHLVSLIGESGKALYSFLRGL